MLLLVTAAVVGWGVTVAADEETLRPGAALAGVLVAAILGAAGCGAMTHAALRPDQWSKASVLAAAFAFGAGALVIGWPLIVFAMIGR